MSCLALTGCGDKRTAAAIRPPAERLACATLGERPKIPAEYVADFTHALVPGDAASTLANARTEHGRFLASVRKREGVVAGHILAVEGRLFACSNDAAWLREFYAALPRTAATSKATAAEQP